MCERRLFEKLPHLLKTGQSECHELLYTLSLKGDVSELMCPCLRHVGADIADSMFRCYWESNDWQRSIHQVYHIWRNCNAAPSAMAIAGPASTAAAASSANERMLYIDVGSGSTIAVGDHLRIHNISCGKSCAVQPPSHPAGLKAVLNGPNELGACGDLQLDATTS